MFFQKEGELFAVNAGAVLSVLTSGSKGSERYFLQTSLTGSEFFIFGAATEKALVLTFVLTLESVN